MQHSEQIQTVGCIRDPADDTPYHVTSSVKEEGNAQCKRQQHPRAIKVSELWACRVPRARTHTPGTQTEDGRRIRGSSLGQNSLS